MTQENASFAQLCANGKLPKSPNGSLSNRYLSATLLPPKFIPGNWDVICQRGKDCLWHVGNRRFRVCIENHVESYMKAKTRQDKTIIISSIVKSISENSPTTGGFVTQNRKTKQWSRVDIKISRDKVGNALRDARKRRYVRGEILSKHDQFALPNMTLEGSTCPSLSKIMEVKTPNSNLSELACTDIQAIWRNSCFDSSVPQGGSNFRATQKMLDFFGYGSLYKPNDFEPVPLKRI